MSYDPYNNNNTNTMDSDRRSNVSSFYQGRKDSFDALTSSAAPQGRPSQQGYGGDDDGRSSFFGMEGGGRPSSVNTANRYSRASGDILPSQGQGQARPSLSGTAGSQAGSQAQRGSYYATAADEEGFNPYREGPLVHSPPERGEDQGWDVFNDFNNAGPRYSDAFGGGIRSLSSGYHKLPPQTPGAIKVESEGLPEGVELVTVPALGPDWKKSEIEGMRTATHRAERWDDRRRKAREWWRDQRSCFGFSRRILVFILFGLCCGLAVVLAITLPRVPGFSFNGQTPLSNATHSDLPFEFSRTPANFTFPALLNIQMDTHSNVISMHVSKLHADIYDLSTDVKVGEGDIPSGITIGAKLFQPVSVPVVFTYVATNSSDQTWIDFHSACENKQVAPQGVRPGVNLRVVVMAKITGLLKTVLASTQISNVPCPFELSPSAP